MEAEECPVPVPINERIGMTVFLAWLFYLGFVTRVMFAPLMPAIEEDLGLSHAQSGSLFFVMACGYMIAPLCSGLISSRYNHRGTLQISAWLVGLALVPFSFIDSVWVVRPLMMVIGLAAGIHLPSAIATIAGEIQKSDWGKGLSIHQAAPPLSFVSAPLIAAFLMNWFKWREVLLIWGGIALCTALVYSLTGRRGDFPGKLPTRQNVSIILRTPSFYLIVLLLSMAMGGNAGIYAMLPLFLVNEHAMELQYANTLVGLSQLSGLVMVFFAGWVADRLGQRPTMTIALLSAGIATILLGLVKGGWLFLVIFIQPALLTAFFPSAFAALSRIAAPHLRSVANALGPPVAFLIGGGCLPAIIGYLGETFTFAAGIMLAGGYMLISPILIYFLVLGRYDDQEGC